MAIGLDFDLQLESRETDCVVVSVLLDPRGEPATLDGVSLQIVGSGGEVVSARMVLPIAGTLAHSMVSTLELRPLDDSIPKGCRVVGVAWSQTEQLEASIPTDPYTELQRHVQAHEPVVPDMEDVTLMRITREERATIARGYPWVNDPRIARHAALLEVVENEAADEEALDELIGELGINDESAEWLKEIMDEDG